jgi:hypothetical protein
MQYYHHRNVVFKCKMEHKSTTTAGSQKCFMAHSGIQLKSGATGRRKKFKRIKATFYGYMLKFDIRDKTDSSRPHVVKLLLINTILYVEYLLTFLYYLFCTFMTNGIYNVSTHVCM